MLPNFSTIVYTIDSCIKLKQSIDYQREISKLEIDLFVKKKKEKKFSLTLLGIIEQSRDSFVVAVTATKRTSAGQIVQRYEDERADPVNSLVSQRSGNLENWQQGIITSGAPRALLERSKIKRFRGWWLKTPIRSPGVLSRQCERAAAPEAAGRSRTRNVAETKRDDLGYFVPKCGPRGNVSMWTT